MQKLIDFVRKIDEETRLHYEWMKSGSKTAALCVGILTSIIIGIIIIPFDSSQNLSQTVRDIILAVMVGVLCGIITSIIMCVVTSWVYNKRAQVAINLDEFISLRRVSETLGSLLFFISPSNFEKTLLWLTKEYHTRSVKFLIAKVIHQQLDRSFGDEKIQLHVGSYAEHSRVVADLLTVAQDVCFTCIKSPRNWFIDLDKHNIEHEELPIILKETIENKINYSNLTKGGYSQENAQLYPVHFIRFLDRPSHSALRRRVFLLRSGEWNDLKTKDNLDFNQKFMLPCIAAGVETVFVNVDQLCANIRSTTDDLSRPILEAIDNNITEQDYDIFEKAALMVYTTAKSESGEADLDDRTHILEFNIGPKVKKYSDFLDIIFSGRLKKRHGVYTCDEVLKNSD